MLKNITRDEMPPPHKPHSNFLKGIRHTEVFNYRDFPNDRKKSTTKFFHNKKKNPNRRKEFEHPSISHFHLSHNHFKNRLPTSMTANDFAPYKYDPSDLYGAKINQRDQRLSAGRENLTKIVSEGFMKNSSSLVNRDPQLTRTAYKQKAVKTRQGLLKSEVKFGEKNFGKKSAYTRFCDDLQTKTKFPRLRGTSGPRDFNIISNQPRADQGKNHFGFDTFTKKYEGVRGKRGNYSSVPPNRGKIFLY